MSYVLKYGRDGLLQITKTGYYSDGKLFIEDSEEKILSEPENKKILVGTKPIISTDHITERESVPFETETVTDGDMYEDERITEREGVCGVVLRVYERARRGSKPQAYIGGENSGGIGNNKNRHKACIYIRNDKEKRKHG